MRKGSTSSCCSNVSRVSGTRTTVTTPKADTVPGTRIPRMCNTGPHKRVQPDKTPVPWKPAAQKSRIPPPGSIPVKKTPVKNGVKNNADDGKQELVAEFLNTELPTAGSISDSEDDVVQCMKAAEANLAADFANDERHLTSSVEVDSYIKTLSDSVDLNSKLEANNYDALMEENRRLRNQLEMIKQVNASLQQQNKDLAFNFESTESRNKTLRSDVSDVQGKLEKDIFELREKLRRREEENKVNLHKLGQADKELKEISSTREKEKNILKKLHTDLSEEKENKKRLLTEMNSKKENVNVVNEMREEMERLRAAHKSQLENVLKENELLRTENESFKISMRTNEEVLTHTANECKNELISLRAANENLSASLHAEGSSRKVLDEQVNTIQNENEALMKKYVDSQDTYRKLENELSSCKTEWKQKTNEKEEEVNKLRKINTQQHEKISDIGNKLAKIEFEMQQSNVTLESRTAELARVEQRLKEKQLNLNNTLSNLQHVSNDKTDAESQRKSVTSRFSTLQKDVLFLHSNLREITQSIVKSGRVDQESATTLNMLMRNMEINMEKLKTAGVPYDTNTVFAKIVAYENTIQKMEADKNTQRAKLKAVEKSNQETQESNSKLNRHLEHAEEVNRHMQSDREQLLIEVQQLRLDSQRHKKEYAQNVEKQRDLDNQLNSLIQRLNEAEAKNESQHQATVYFKEDSLKQQIRVLENENNTLKETISKLEGNQHNLIMKHRERQQLQQKQIDDLTQQCSKDTALVKQQADMYQSRLDVINSLELKLKDQERKNATLEEKINRIEANQTIPLSSNMNFSSQLPPAMVLPGAVNPTNYALQELTRQLETMRNQLDQENNVKSTLSTQIKAIGSLEKTVKRLEKEKNRLDIEFCQYRDWAASQLVDQTQLSRVRKEVDFQARHEIDARISDLTHRLSDQSAAQHESDKFKEDNSTEMKKHLDQARKEMAIEIERLSRSQSQLASERDKLSNDNYKLAQLLTNNPTIREAQREYVNDTEIVSPGVQLRPEREQTALPTAVHDTPSRSDIAVSGYATWLRNPIQPLNNDQYVAGGGGYDSGSNFNVVSKYATANVFNKPSQSRRGSGSSFSSYQARSIVPGTDISTAKMPRAPYP